MADARTLPKFRMAGVAVVAAAMLVAAVLSERPSRAAATPPPVTGTVTCSLTATSTFWPFVGYEQSLASRHVGPRAKSVWKLLGTLSECSGTQSGGRPTTVLPIQHGDIKITARASGHQCADVEDSALEVRSIRVRWFDTLGKRVGTTRVVHDGSIHVANLGVLAFLFPPPTPPPEPPTFSGSGIALATSHVFPGQVVTLAGIGDPVYLALPCSTTDQPPGIPRGIPGVTFSGVSGTSTVSVSS
ncbi:MAG: hypothetical protein ACXV8R_10770 [Acidimicrobiia bacterium]